MPSYACRTSVKKTLGFGGGDVWVQTGVRISKTDESASGDGWAVTCEPTNLLAAPQK